MTHASSTPKNKAGAIASATEWLTERGYRVVDGDSNVPRALVPLIVMDGQQTVFVVVKSVRVRGFGAAIELVDRRKSQRLVRAISTYLAEQPDVPSVRIDVVAVRLGAGGNWKLEHYVNAVP